ncbi:PREDICTED: ejaculatory bulb-specific protein 3-like [Papilio xuthus]|uniref:Chemosensory protein n=1 Tax=Papilio xuthus TaxID=66420 RepID=A8QWQ6_PAPXU|nr:ejaculatory bulb-specific protein 3-like precursor [Papilio xuthus]XP_013162614.1 PREDICTED: ejaculatory bulb-specific protein 3-like [Papilio xuthus]XP_013162615.1 PREDICTED: ejaculatory bulb-specific protein 3-like [Papilio xuthus]XP_013162616.1 PREDICTED: ejaculatory bulb-specific protein 3-like [Papilio xuthus]BAF91716.1 chemosensory protein [Papilio xuthus]
MKTIILLCTLAAAALAAPADTYNSQYDNFDATELVGNTRLLKSYGRCFLGQGPCTAEGSDFKKTIPEALRTTCAKCTPKQRELVRVVVRGFQTKLPEIWEELVKQQDPKGEFKEAFDRFLNSSD